MELSRQVELPPYLVTVYTLYRVPLGETTRCLPLYGITYSFYLLSLTPFDSYRHPYIRLFPGLEPCAVQQLLCSMHHSLTPLPPTIALVSPREPHWRALLVSVVLRMYRRHARTSQRLSSANTLPSRTYTLIQPSSTTNFTSAVYPPPSNNQPYDRVAHTASHVELLNRRVSTLSVKNKQGHQSGIVLKKDFIRSASK